VRVSDGTASNCLTDLGRLLLGLAQDAKDDAALSGDAFQRGRQMGLYEAVSLLAQQADAFGMSRDEVGLGDVDPERDLL
jgi:hypothetical protein